MFLKNLTNKYNLTQILLLVIALLIPLEKTTMRIAIIVVSLVCILKGDYKVFLKRTSWIKLIPTALWVLPFLQLFFLSKLNVHWSHLETKLSLLLFPFFILIGVELKKNFINELLKIFIVGCSISIIICLANSTFNFIYNNHSDSFYYKKLSFIHHPSYYSMYLNFAIGILYINLVSKVNELKIQKKWSWILIISFTIFIVLVSSRTGWISNVIINSIFMIVLIKRKFFKKRDLLVGFILLLTAGVFINISSPIKNRFNEIIKHTLYSKKQSNYPSSTSTRIKAWKSTVELIQKNWLTGFGTGIGRIELNKTYVSKGYISLKKKNTNTHNQYLQYLLDHGIIGFLFLFFLTIIMLIISLKERDYVYTIFIFLLIINFMTESILETQSGIVFFALFNTIFFFHWINKKAIAN